MSEPRGSGVPEEAHNDVHDLETLTESSAEVSRLTALEHHSGVCEWTVSDVFLLLAVT